MWHDMVSAEWYGNTLHTRGKNEMCTPTTAWTFRYTTVYTLQPNSCKQLYQNMVNQTGLNNLYSTLVLLFGFVWA